MYTLLSLQPRPPRPSKELPCHTARAFHHAAPTSQVQPRIAIVGGGPAGLTFGLLLHQRGIPFTIFELRQKPSDKELGMLDLHNESGLAAIRECGLFGQFLQLTGECTEADKVADMHGNILYADKGGVSERPEISRHALTKLLSSHLPVEAIKWDHKLLSAASFTAPSGTTTQTELDFGSDPHRSKQAFDLVIGADGAWSRIRSMLTDVRPHYAGTQNITTTVRHITIRYPHLAALVGRGSFAALGLRHGIMAQRGPQDSARVYVFLTTADEEFAVSSRLNSQRAMTAAEAKHLFLHNYALPGHWGPALKDLVTVACDEESADNPGAAVDIKPLYMLPIGTSWEHKAGATLIGEAAHLMCPWAGEGVNLAMWDALLLARAIIKAHEATISVGQLDVTASFQSALNPLVEDFEASMVARSKEKAEETYNNGQILFGEDGAKAFSGSFLSAFGGK